MGKGSSTITAGLLVAVLVTTVGFSLFQGYQKKTDSRVLILGHNLPTSHPVHKAMLSMKDRLEEISDGALTMQIHPGSVLGAETECIEQLQFGTLAMTKTSAAAIENFMPSMAVFSLPYVFRDGEHYWDVLEGEVGKELLEKGETAGLRGMCYYDGGSRNFYSKDKPIRTPDDLKGMKIRVMNSQTAMEMVKSMGGAPTPISFGELYSALAQGTVDGAENNPPSFASNKHFEVCKHFTLDGHSRVPDVLLISGIVWDSLSPQEQEWVQQAANESSLFQRELWEKESIAALEAAREAGVTVYEVDTALFAAKVKPMLEKIKNEEVKSLLNRIEQVK